ncbi:MAG: CxxxxCH/CxxCH domain-containing protein [Deltaproteobacteria bacterium]
MTVTRVQQVAVTAFLAILFQGCSSPRTAASASPVPDPATCSMCHGTAGRVGNLPGTDPLLASAPPLLPTGRPASMVGAHLVHLNPPVNGPLRAPIACNECHVVPTGLSHATNPPASPVQFGTLAQARGASPTYEPLSLGCSAVYCHGNFDFGGVKGKTATVTWTGGVVGCGACHDLPPTGHPPLPGTVTPSTCSQCHPGTVNPDGGINVASGAHINGQADVAYSCTACHGTAGRIGFQQGTDVQLSSAPPAAPAGAPAYAVGAHQAHLNPPLTGSMGAPIVCAECHVVPSTPDHAANPPPQKVVFGALARTQGASPTWTSTTTGCAATYCHGNFTFNGVTGLAATPLWTGAPLACGSCHGMPPTGHQALTAPVTPATCSACHPTTVSPDGSINLTGGAHLNGKADVLLDCTGCHGTAGRTGILPGTDPQLAAAPPVVPAGIPATAVGAHLSHLNPPASGSFRGPVACAECHVVPASSAHAVNPPAQRVVFGTLASNRGATPSYVPATLGCSATYCHGSFSFNGVSGASAAPVWTATGLGCTSCHGMPPTGHPPISGTVSPSTCNQCHPSSVNPDGSINLAAGAHLNGQADLNANCTSCHGTAGRTGFLPGTDPQLAASPPVAVTSPAATGAHQAHVNPPTSGGLRTPLLCGECHVVPQDSAHANTPPASPVAFGTLAQTQGASPTWNGATLGCSATYCHGTFSYAGIRGAAATPLWSEAWTGTNAGKCLNCHGLPPTGHPALAGTVTASTCSQCHPSTVNPDGTINTGPTGGAHVNGKADVAGASCTSCHGDPARTVPAGNPNALLAAAPPVAPPGKPASVVGTHLLHLTDSAIRSAISCNECHVVPTNPDHSVTLPPVVVFSPGTLATTQNVAPSYVPTSLSCSAAYCHGNFTFGSVKGNATPTAAWNVTPSLACTGCHGMPPTGHQALTAPVTPATCNGCHSATVKADGTIDLAGGKHMNGLAEYTGGHPAGWADKTQHGYSANQQGLQNCTSCHVGFGAAGGLASSSCNTCHASALHPSWQTECTFCHGTAGRTPTALNPLIAATPPVDSAGNSATTSPRVGAHAKHVLSPTLSSAFACANCHESSLPTDVAHVDGARAPLPFGLLALTGNVTPTYNATTLGCAATYCHGNFTSGKATSVPVWNVPSSGTLACNSCHSMPNASTGHHSTHGGGSFNCSDCHSGIATGTGASNAAIVGPALHVNGVKNVVIAPANAITYTAATRRCNGTCHGQNHSSYAW